MNIQEEHQHYKHFESWVAEYVQIDSDHASLPLLSLIHVYASTYPGRTARLMCDLVNVARMWISVHDREKLLTELNKGLTHHPTCRPTSCHSDCLVGYK